LLHQVPRVDPARTRPHGHPGLPRGRVPPGRGRRRRPAVRSRRSRRRGTLPRATRPPPPRPVRDLPDRFQDLDEEEE